MVLVDVFVPSVDMTYDFQLNDDVPVKQVIEEVAQMIEQKERTKVIGNIDELILCRKAGEIILNPTISLAENGVSSGQSLILI